MRQFLNVCAAVLLSAVAFRANAQEQEWVNYSNFSAVTDVEPIGEHLWITAKGGVLKLNTLTSEKTYYKKGDAGLPSASVEQIAVDATSGTIWVGTYDAGVVEWDGSNWITYAYPTTFLLYRMKIDDYGDVWLQTDAGLYKFDTDAHTYTFINSLGGAGWSFEAWDFDITPENTVLVFTGEDCLVIDAATNMAIDSFPNSTSPVVLGCSPTTVRIYGVDENTYLINNSGLLEFQFMDGTYAEAMDGLPEFAFISNITRGTDDNLYALVDATSIYKLVGLTWESVNNLVGEYSDKLQFTDGNTFYLNGGGYMEPPTVLQLDDDLVTHEVQQYNFTSNVITGIVKDNDEHIFMTSGTAIYQFNAIAENWDFVMDVPAIYNSLMDLRYYNNQFYVIDYGNLIEYYDGTSWIHIPLAAGYSSIYVFDYDVSSTGVIYFTNEEGVFKSEGGVTTNLFETTELANWCLSIEYDEVNNLVWLGRINGIIKYDFISQELINSADVPALAAGSSIQEIEQDAAGNIWFGANSGKLYRYDGTTWTDFTASAEGDFVVNINFMGNSVYCGLNGALGGLWIYDTETETETVINMTTDSMMPSANFFNFTVSNEGVIWFGHSDLGVSVLRFNSDPIAINNYAENNFVIYPNPAQQFITFEALNVNANKFQVIDLTGKMLLESTNPTMDISTLASGVYLAKTIDDANNVNICKFVVIR